MKSLRVNADYETELFYGHSGAAIMNQSLEFLTFFLETNPIFTAKKYPPAYFEYIESIVGSKPTLISSGEFKNWWGELRDLELERKLNSKVTSSELCISQLKECNIQIIHTLSDYHAPESQVPMIAKNPYGMSGQKFKLFTPEALISEGPEWLKKSLPHGPIILEPLLKRQKDFSHFVFPDEKVICYQNLIDHKFQYRGTLFRDIQKPSIQSLAFYSDIDPRNWETFKHQLALIQNYYSSFPSEFGYSIDSFTFQGEFHSQIRTLCEVNFRRTMGRVAYDLSSKVASKLTWSLFLMGKSQGSKGGFQFLHKTLKPILLNSENESGIVILSPGDTRFEIFLIKARDEKSGLECLRKLKELLPDGEFAIEL